MALEATASPTTATKPIETIRVGQRVLGENPLRDEVDFSLPEPEQASWRLLRLKMMKSAGHELAVELLRPMTWIDEQGATVDGTIMGSGTLFLPLATLVNDGTIAPGDD